MIGITCIKPSLIIAKATCKSSRGKLAVLECASASTETTKTSDSYIHLECNRKQVQNENHESNKCVAFRAGYSVSACILLHRDTSLPKWLQQIKV